VTAVSDMRTLRDATPRVISVRAVKRSA